MVGGGPRLMRWRMIFPKSTPSRNALVVQPSDLDVHRLPQKVVADSWTLNRQLSPSRAMIDGG